MVWLFPYLLVLFIIERAMFCVVAPHEGLITDCGQRKQNKICDLPQENMQLGLTVQMALPVQ